MKTHGKLHFLIYVNTMTKLMREWRLVEEGLAVQLMSLVMSGTDQVNIENWGKKIERKRWKNYIFLLYINKTIRTAR